MGKNPERGWTLIFVNYRVQHSMKFIYVNKVF